MSKNDEAPRSQPLPKPQEVLSEVEARDGDVADGYEQRFQEEFEPWSADRELDYVHLEGARDHYKQKAKWSRFLMWSVGGMLVFQAALLTAVGLGSLDFSSYEWLLPALLVQTLGQVIGLAIYAVKYLFSDITRMK